VQLQLDLYDQEELMSIIANAILLERFRRAWRGSCISISVVVLVNPGAPYIQVLLLLYYFQA